MDKRNESRRVFTQALEEAEGEGLEVTPKPKNKVLVTNPSTGETRTFSQAPGGARGLPNALSQLRRLKEGVVPRIGVTAKVGSLDGLIPVKDPDKLSVSQRAYMVWHQINQHAEQVEASIVKAAVNARGKLTLGSRSQHAGDFYGVELDHGLTAFHDALFPSMRGWKNGTEAVIDYLRLSGNAYYLNAADRHKRRWLIRVEWKHSDVEVPEPEPDPAPEPRRRTLPPPAAPQVLTTYRCRFVGCNEEHFLTEGDRDEHEHTHTTPESIVLPSDTAPQEDSMAAALNEIVLPVPLPALTGDPDLDAAILMLAEQVRERLMRHSPVVALAQTEADLASRLRERSDEVMALRARVRDLEDFMLSVEQYVEDGQPMAAIQFITQFFSDGHSSVA
jgi:hypothetical protein